MTSLAKKGRLFKIIMEGLEDYASEAQHDEAYHLVRVKAFALKPMTPDEAILQMNMLDHQFYLFENEENNQVCVVYKRHDGNYGLLEPQI